MNVKTVKKAEVRIDFPNISNLGIISYGHNNLYPQEIRAIVACSESGTSCLNRYIKFIQGNGFEDVAFSETVINKRGDTIDDILTLISDDLGTYNGFSLHVNYNALCDIVELSHIPFENTRLSVEDENGYIGTISVFPDWTGTHKRGTKTLKPTNDAIDRIDIFNPDKAVISAQIEASGGIDNYKGQILWVSGSGKEEYPRPIYDCIVTQMSTEEGLGNISLRNARNGLFPAKALVIKKGQDIATDENDDENKAEFDRDQDANAIANAFASAQGDMNQSKIVMITVEHDEDIPQMLDLQGANYDKDFTVTSDTCCEKIYSAFGHEVWHRLRKGSVGFSSEIMRDAYDVCSSMTGTERRMIERAFDKIFKYWHTPVSTSDFTIQPLKYISSETPDNSK